MRALRFHGNKDMRVDEIPVPPLKPGWVKVKNAWAGICGSDLHEYSVGPLNTPVKPHALTGETIPTVCGHEFSGVVAELGKGVSDLQIGQKVAVFPPVTDGVCYWCEQNIYGMCENWGFLGLSGFGGGMSEYICVERKAIHKIPDGLSLEVAALVEPLAVAWHAVKKSNISPKDHCLIAGAGPIGIAVIHCLLAYGVQSIVVSEPSLARAAHARGAGAPYVLDPTKEDVAKFCKELTDGRGVHVAYDCAGVQPAFDVLLLSLRGKGAIVQVANYETPLTIKTPNIITRRQLTLTGSNIYTREEFQEVIDMLALGKFKDVEKMITAKISLNDAVTKGFHVLLNERDKHVKILINTQE